MDPDEYLADLREDGGFPQHCGNQSDGPVCMKPLQCLETGKCYLKHLPRDVNEIGTTTRVQKGLK